jgi:hypothetical protein
MSLRIKHVSGHSLFVGNPDAIKPVPKPTPRPPQWPNAVAISLPTGILTFKYSPLVSYRKHRHAASRNGAVCAAGMVA